MGFEQGRQDMRAEIARTTVDRIFETLVSDVSALGGKLALGLIDRGAYIEGVELLVPRLRRFGPGGPADAISQRCETVLMNALTEGEAVDEPGDAPTDNG